MLERTWWWWWEGEKEESEYIPVTKNGMQMEDEVLFLGWECTTFEVRSEVIDPTKTTTFATSLETSIPCNVTPTTLSICEHVPYQLLIFIRWPQPFPQLALITLLHSVLVCHQIRFPHSPMLLEWSQKL